MMFSAKDVSITKECTIIAKLVARAKKKSTKLRLLMS